MKIVCISDTHGKHRQFEVPDGDVLVFAGDIMTDGWFWPEISDFNQWLGSQPHPHKLVIAGNHDRLFESNPVFSKGLLTNATYLENSGVEIDGVKFWGSPQQPEFCNWAFNVPRGEEIKRFWDQIPEDTDVLITHGPPHGILDTIHPIRGKKHLGCEELAKAVERILPKVHVFGHIHGGYGGPVSRGILARSTTFVNASLVDEAYKPTHKPIVVEVC